MDLNESAENIAKLKAENELFRGILKQVYLSLDYRGSAAIFEILEMTRDYGARDKES